VNGAQKPRVLVTGATGTVGRGGTAALLARGADVRALVRDPVPAAKVLGRGPALAVGEFGDPASVVAATAGVDAVFLCAANDPRQLEWEDTVIRAASATGVGRLVKLSAHGARAGAPVAFWDTHARIEARLAGYGPGWVILRPTFFTSNLLAAAGSVRAAGALFAPAGDARIALVDPRDVAAVAAETLLSGGHDGRTYVLTGPAALTYGEVAGQLAAALDRPVRYVEVSDAQAVAAMVDAGLPAWTAQQVAAVWGELRRGAAATPTDVVRVLLGREPRTVGDFCADHAALFR
jgi:uncharacterized protein YbjT (DUF2867 family)